MCPVALHIRKVLPSTASQWFSICLTVSDRPAASSCCLCVRGKDIKTLQRYNWVELGSCSPFQNGTTKHWKVKGSLETPYTRWKFTILCFVDRIPKQDYHTHTSKSERVTGNTTYKLEVNNFMFCWPYSKTGIPHIYRKVKVSLETPHTSWKFTILCFCASWYDPCK